MSTDLTALRDALNVAARSYSEALARETESLTARFLASRPDLRADQIQLVTKHEADRVLLWVEEKRP